MHSYKCSLILTLTFSKNHGSVEPIIIIMFCCRCLACSRATNTPPSWRSARKERRRRAWCWTPMRSCINGSPVRWSGTCTWCSPWTRHPRVWRTERPPRLPSSTGALDACYHPYISCIWSVHAFPGTQTHDLAIASAVIYRFSYRSAGHVCLHEELLMSVSIHTLLCKFWDIALKKKNTGRKCHDVCEF